MVTSSASTTNAAFAEVVPAGQRLKANALNGLSLANGMTAGYGVNDGHYNNPPAFNKDGKKTYGGNPKWAPRRIGVMRNTPGILPHIYSLYFIFNPNQIYSAFYTNQGNIPPTYTYGAGYTGSDTNKVKGVPVPNISNQQSVSWSLIFDRTYDMRYGPNPGDQRGVLTDVAALYNLMGTFETTGATPMSTPVQVAFGQNSAGQLWGFTGFISSVAITYGIFRWDMIPARCEVDITMTATYVTNHTVHSGSPTKPKKLAAINSALGIVSGPPLKNA